MKQLVPLVLLTVIASSTFSQQRIIFSEQERDRIFHMNTDGSDLQLVVGKMWVSDIHYDWVNDKLVFTDETNGDIKRCDPDGANLEVIIDNLQEPSSLSIDKRHELMYWVEGAEIYSAELNGANPTLVYSHDSVLGDISFSSLQSIIYILTDAEVIALDLEDNTISVLDDESTSGQEIVVDPEQDVLFFLATAPNSEDQVLYRMDTDGFRKEQLSTRAESISSLAIDTINSRLFYTGLDIPQTYSNNYLGSDEQTIFSFGFQPQEITMNPDGAKPYFVNLEDLSRIQQFDLDFDIYELESILYDKIDVPASVAYDKADDMFYYLNLTNNGGRDSTEALYRTTLEGETFSQLLTQPLLMTPLDMALDKAANEIYIVNQREIIKTDFEGTNVSELFADGSLKSSVAIDFENEQMYWYDSSNRHIRRGNLDGTGDSEDLITDGIVFLEDLEINVQEGKMYWTASRDDALVKANLDGTQVEAIMTVEDPIDLYIDDVGEKIYLATETQIISANLDGTDQQIIMDGVFAPLGGLTLSESFVSRADATLTQGISVYPNPTSDYLIIDSPVSDARFTLSDLQGRNVISGALRTGLNHISLSSLESGTYFLQYLNKESFMYSAKVVVTD